MTEDVMRTRKRVPSTGSDRSREGEPKRWASPRKKQRTKYVSTEGSDTSDSNSDSVDENEETSEEMLPKSEDKNNNKEEVGPDEQPVETSEDQTDGQNGEQKSDVAIDIVSTVSQRKPLLILRRLEHLQGDFHLLLNDVVLLQNGSGSMSTETQSKEKVDPSKDESPEAAETSEPQEETLSHCSDTQNEEQDEVEHMPIEDTVIFQDQGVDTISLQEVIIENIKNEVEMVAPISQINLESVEEDTTPPNVIIEYSAQLTERPPQEENPSALIDEPPETAQTDSEVDIMDLEQLKKEKIKWQIKVLKLQEVYYSLQIQKLKQ